MRYVDVASEFPDLISRWDFERNEELDPSSVAMYVDVAAWMCPEGHPTTGTVYNIARAKLHCTVCTERRVVTGINDFQTLYPDKAREFAVSLNGGLTPDKVSTHSSKPYKFICRRGHVYEVSTRERVDLDIGCTKCTGRMCIPGETDLLTVKPLVAARWDYARNGELTPDHVHPGTAKTAFFECLCGEPWRTEIRAMRPDRYCRKCAAGIRSGRITL